MPHFDKVQARMLFDWSSMGPDFIIEEELGKIEALINGVLDDHYQDDTTLDLTLVTYEGKLELGENQEGWMVDHDMVWDRIPGDTREEKTQWIKERFGDDLGRGLD
jgi:hypothetical protein